MTDFVSEDFCDEGFLLVAFFSDVFFLGLVNELFSVEVSTTGVCVGVGVGSSKLVFSVEEILNVLLIRFLMLFHI
jgi:hypothetical protein